jgi:3-oxoacyl-[acyl-carrier protein] reductase
MSEVKIALVTGASRGIGKAIALKLAHDGYHVVGTATTESGAKNIQSYFDEAGVKGDGMTLDISNKDTVEPFLEQLEATCGSTPAILINNAGITRDNLLLRMDDEEWDSVLETNLSGLFRLTKACIKTMFRARWGRIVNVSSVVASMGNAGQTNYATTKAGILGFTRSLACEIASRNITVNAVSPGFIDTDMTKGLPDLVAQEMLKRVPMKKLGQPEDVANAVAFLVSDGAAYITGENIHVNGGLYMA